MGLNLEYSSGQTPINADEIDGLKTQHRASRSMDNEAKNEYRQVNNRKVYSFASSQNVQRCLEMGRQIQNE